VDPRQFQTTGNVRSFVECARSLRAATAAAWVRELRATRVSEQATQCSPARVSEQDQNRHASLHNFSTEFHGHQNRKIGQSQVTEAKPVSFYRELEPNKYLNAPDLEGARYVLHPVYARMRVYMYA